MRKRKRKHKHAFDQPTISNSTQATEAEMHSTRCETPKTPQPGVIPRKPDPLSGQQTIAHGWESPIHPYPQ